MLQLRRAHCQPDSAEHPPEAGRSLALRRRGKPASPVLYTHFSVWLPASTTALVCGQENVVVDDVPLWPEGSTCKPSADVGSGRGAALSPTKTIAPVIRKVIFGRENVVWKRPKPERWAAGRGDAGDWAGRCALWGHDHRHRGGVDQVGRPSDRHFRASRTQTYHTDTDRTEAVLNCLVLCARRTTATASTPPSG